MRAASTFLSFILLGFAAVALAEGDWISYTHPKEKFTVQYPGDWDPTEDFEYEAFLIPFLALQAPQDGSDPFRENFNVVSEGMGSKLTAKAYLEMSLKQIRTGLVDFKELEKGEFKGGATEGWFLVYRHTESLAGELQVMVFCFTSGKKGYALTCTSTPADFENYRETFLGIGKSFKP